MNIYREMQKDSAVEAEKLCRFFSLFQFVLAVFIAVFYFYFEHWLSGLMIIGMITALIQPAMFFYFVSLESKLNFNDEMTDEQHQRTVREANELFYKMDNEINSLKERLLELEGRLGLDDE